MDIQDYFKLVENVLKNFPIQYQKNYYRNKSNVVMNFEEQTSYNCVSGRYDNDTNTITIYDKNALPHELFHMACRNPKKVNKKLYRNEDCTLYYHNGVALDCHYNHKKKTNKLNNKGIQEGFVEYLSRKCNIINGQYYNFFFVDLLISIYGEDILKYPLKNDPCGFLTDKRFYDIFKISRELDYVNTIIDIIIRNIEKFHKKIIEEQNELYINNTKKMMDICISSVISLFENITNEYNNCVNPKITKEEYIKKLEKFTYEEDYLIVNKFDKHNLIQGKIIEIKDKIRNDTVVLKKVYKK